jgi:hypothetical protein
MRPATHAKLAAIAVLLWLAFWIGGLPDYYQQYSFWVMLTFCLALVPAIVLVAWKVIGRVAVDRRRRFGFWLSFYFTVPFLLLDFAYCGLYLGHGWHFLIAYWYLTIFYILLWLLIVPIARMRSAPAGASFVRW